MEAAHLSTLEEQILAFERQWHTFGGVKEHAIREQFNLSSTAYFQILNSLLDNPEAYERDPILIKRLRRIRDGRRRNSAQARMAR